MGYYTGKTRLTLLCLLLSLLAFVVGCGGGDGSSSTGVSPVEVEIQTVLSSLATAVKSEDLSSVMENFYSNLRYYPDNPAIPGGFEDYAKFRQRLNVFFTGAKVTDFSFTSIGINEGLEDVAMARVQLSCSYNDGAADKQIVEQVEIKLERDSKWGIIEIYKYDSVVGQTGMTFPPKL